MKTYSIEVNKRAIIGISPGTEVAIVVNGGTRYACEIEKIANALARIHRREHPHPAGKTRRRFSKAVTGEERRAEREAFQRREQMGKSRA